MYSYSRGQGKEKVFTKERVIDMYEGMNDNEQNYNGTSANENMNNTGNANSTENSAANGQSQGSTGTDNGTTGNGGAGNNYNNGGSNYGNYQYSNNNNGAYHNPYNSGYGSNPTPDGGKNNKENKPHKKGNGSKVVLAIAMAAVFGLCVGAGIYGVGRIASGSTQSASEDKSESSGSEATLKQAQAGDNSDEASSEGTTSSESATASASGLSIAGDSSDESVGVTTVDVSSIAAKCMPSIVSVYNSATVQAQDFFGQTYTTEQESTGSGIIISQTDTELLIATNNHVVEGADELTVKFIDDSTVTANIKGTDSNNDLAVIAVKLSDITDDTKDQISVATLGDSDKLKVGEAAIAIGNALNYGQSVTAGVVSAVNRELQTSTDSETTYTFIQTDAAINPGNSGGALLNSKGEVIGINSSKIGATTVEGMGYAIPISRAIPIIEDLMNQETKEKVSEDDQGYLGISGISVTSDVASAYNMPQGVYVESIMDGSGAASSDLKEGDIITGINGTTIDSMDALKAQLEYYKAGTEVTLTVERANNNKYTEASVKLTLSDKSVVESSQSSDSSTGSSENAIGGSTDDQQGQNQGQSSGWSTTPFSGFFGNGTN
jgi:serine protease Do